MVHGRGRAVLGGVNVLSCFANRAKEVMGQSSTLRWNVTRTECLDAPFPSLRTGGRPVVLKSAAAFCFLLVFTLPCLAQSKPAQQASSEDKPAIAWEPDFDAALARAQSQKEGVFGGDCLRRCGFCRRRCRGVII